MMLRTRAAVAGALLAVPVAALAVAHHDRVRARDLELALGRVVQSQVNAQVRERCESDPRWFLTGPLDGRPAGGDPPNADSDPNAVPARPKVSPQPFELFAYDERFGGSSPAAPRFPLDMRQALQAAAPGVARPYETDGGTGVQIAVPTGWIGSPCMYFLGRMEPPPDQASARRWLFVLSYLAAFLVAAAAAAPMIGRVRKLSRLAQAAKQDGFTTVALDGRKDELNAVTFVYNDAVNELRLRKARVDDLDAGLRRFVQSTADEVAGPLRELERTLSAPRPDDAAALVQAHELSARVDNLTAAATLRMSGPPGEPGDLELTGLVAGVVQRHEPIARAHGVSIAASLPDAPIRIRADEALAERAVANLVDNAVRYNRPNGTVSVRLDRDGDRAFRLTVTDTGRGISAEDFKTLTAIRRFRGDEHRSRRPGAPGLGLSVAKEVADRFGLHLDLKRPGAGGFEVELSGPAA